MKTKFIKETLVKFSRIAAATIATIGSLAITLAAISSLTFTAPAYAQSAAPTDPDGAPPPSLELRKIPPSCVVADENNGDTVIVTNGCDTWERVKVLVAFGPDSACKNIAPGATDEHTYPSFGRFDGLQSC